MGSDINKAAPADRLILLRYEKANDHGDGSLDPMCSHQMKEHGCGKRYQLLTQMETQGTVKYSGVNDMKTALERNWHRISEILNVASPQSTGNI